MFFTTLYRFFFSFSLIFYNNRSSHNIHSSGREITCINMYNNNNNNNNHTMLSGWPSCPTCGVQQCVIMFVDNVEGVCQTNIHLLNNKLNTYCHYFFSVFYSEG